MVQYLPNISTLASSIKSGEEDSMPLARGDVLRVPIVGDQRTPATRVRRMVVDGVLQTANGVTYCLRDQSGPVILIRHARLRWLRERFEQELHNVDV